MKMLFVILLIIRRGEVILDRVQAQGQLGFLHCCTHLSLKFSQLKESQIFKAAFVIKVSKAKYSAQASFIQLPVHVHGHLNILKKGKVKGHFRFTQIQYIFKVKLNLCPSGCSLRTIVFLFHNINYGNVNRYF